MKIFLDTRDWIILTKIDSGIETDPNLIRVYEKIKKLSKSKHAIFPFSMYHLEDIMKRSNKQSRNQVIDVMIDISQGWVMKPYLLFFKKEIENAALNRLGIPSIHDIQNQIFGKGLPYLAGEEYSITSSTTLGKKLLIERGDELRKITNSLSTMKLILKDPKNVSYFRKWGKQYVALARKFDRNRQYKSHMTKSERYNYELAAHYSKSIIPHLIKFLCNYNIHPDKLDLTKRSDLNAFLENMPAINVFLKLLIARDDESPERKAKPNDMTDINHLAGAIPYCDIVVVEKMFANLAKKQHLDKKYNSILCNSLQELDVVLS